MKSAILAKCLLPILPVLSRQLVQSIREHSKYPDRIGSYPRRQPMDIEVFALRSWYPSQLNVVHTYLRSGLLASAARFQYVCTALVCDRGLSEDSSSCEINANHSVGDDWHRVHGTSLRGFFKRIGASSRLCISLASRFPIPCLIILPRMANETSTRTAPGSR